MNWKAIWARMQEQTSELSKWEAILSLAERVAVGLGWASVRPVAYLQRTEREL